MIARLGRALGVALIFLVLVAAAAAPVAAAGAIALDGAFGDWAGQACLGDPAEDAATRGDIAQFCWATNPDDATLYFEVVRVDQPTNASPATYVVYLDTNNNGVYTDAADRTITVKYQPKNNDTSTVGVTVATAGGATLGSTGGDWGDSFETGSTRVEFGAGFADLGITARQPIRFYVTSSDGDRAPDDGDVQVAPVPVLGLGWALPPLAALTAGVGLWAGVRQRGWR
ncbi:MAG TPA: hypothetical protein VFW96_04875 [Thermomicrobiales bacterium]|nr:hypothetical protein [Thermomicrobiales bacterium]